MINQSRFKFLRIDPTRVRELIESIEEQENEIKEFLDRYPRKV